MKAQKRWPLLVIGAPAFVAVWSGWVGLGGLTGFGEVHPLPGIADGVVLDTAITLPVGGEAFAVYALHLATRQGTNDRARRFAWRASIGGLALGWLGQVAYHLMIQAGQTKAPWWVTMSVAGLPVMVVGAAAYLWHLAAEPRPEALSTPEPEARGIASEAPEASPEAQELPRRHAPEAPEAEATGPGPARGEARGIASEAPEASPEAQELPRRHAPEAPEAEATGPGPARGEARGIASEAMSPGPGASLQDVMDALEAGRLPAVSRMALKDHFKIGSVKADRLAQEYRQAVQG